MAAKAFASSFSLIASIKQISASRLLQLCYQNATIIYLAPRFQTRKRETSIRAIVKGSNSLEINNFVLPLNSFIHRREHCNAKFYLLPELEIQIWPKFHKSDRAQIMVTTMMELCKQPSANANWETVMDHL